MNACPKWREELIDHALGGLPAAALQAHLATCAGCSEALEAWRRKAAQIDTGVQQLIAAEPRAQGPERVLTQIQRSPVKPFYGRVALAALMLTVSLVGYGTLHLALSNSIVTALGSRSFAEESAALGGKIL